MKSTVKDIVTFAELCNSLNVNACIFTTLWIKKQSKINPDEKIMPSDEEWKLANEQLFLAEKIITNADMKFQWTGWDGHPDDYMKKKYRVMQAQGQDSFEKDT